MALVLSLVSSLFILLSRGTCFIPGPWHHVAVVTFLLSLPPAYLFFCHEVFVYPWPLTPYCCGDVCFIPGLLLIYSFVIWHLFYLWPLTPYCCGDACFIPGLQLIYPFVMIGLFCLWPLTPCCYDDACFIPHLQLIFLVMRFLSYPWSLTLVIYLKYLSLMS